MDLAAEAFRLWPGAVKIVDPVMADGGKPYSGFTPAVIQKVRTLCSSADLILPNLTEAKLLLDQDPVLSDGSISAEEALELASQLTGIERSGQCRLVDNSAACDVDQEGRRLHAGELAGTDPAELPAGSYELAGTVEGYEQTEGLLVVVRTSAPFTPEQKETFINWLKIRTNSQNVTLYEVNE